MFYYILMFHRILLSHVPMFHHITVCLCIIAVADACDFDTSTSYEDAPCSAWSLPPATDGQPGFVRTSGERLQASGLSGPLVDYTRAQKNGESIY